MAEQRKPLLPVSQSPIGTHGHVGFQPATEKQAALLRKLLGASDMNTQVQETLIAKLDNGHMSKREAGNLIIRLRSRPRKSYGTYVTNR